MTTILFVIFCSIYPYTHTKYTTYEQILSNQDGLMFTESILEICGVGLQESGEYLCTASNGARTVQAPNATVLTVLSNGGREVFYGVH